MGCGKTKEAYRPIVLEPQSPLKNSKPAAGTNEDKRPAVVKSADKQQAPKKPIVAKPALPEVAPAVPVAVTQPVAEQIRVTASVAPPSAAPLSSAPEALWQLSEESPLALEIVKLRRQLDSLRRIGNYTQALGSSEPSLDHFEREPYDGHAGSGRFDSAHERMQPELDEVESESSAEGSSLGWLVLGVGLCATAFGGVLSGWSWATERIDLWNIGFPVLIVGQISVLLGIVIELDGLRRKRTMSAPSTSATNSLSRHQEEMNSERGNGSRVRADDPQQFASASHVRRSSVRGYNRQRQ